MSDYQATLDAIDDVTLEEARSDREGQTWFEEELGGATAEGAQPPLPSSATPISQKAFDLIVFFEVTSKEQYTQRYQKPIWPKERSGVTIGIGYDVGYVTAAQLRADWGGVITEEMITALQRGVGVKGDAAAPVAAALRHQVSVTWEQAIAVHKAKVIPRWIALVEQRLPNTALLDDDCLGALVSLTYNRGASFAKEGPRYAEMRAICAHMANKAFSKIDDEISAMRRLWPNSAGLRKRREVEAALFRDGLAEQPQARL